MIAALLLLSLSGYFVVRWWLDDDDVLAAAGLGTALGWCGFVTVLNLLLRAGLPFGVATPLSMGLMLLAGVVGFVRLRRHGRGRAILDRTDLALVVLCAAPASLLIFFYQFLGPDSDNFIHYPLVALFLKGQFPHINPYFPDLFLHGHYGRDLGLGGLLHFGRIGTGTAMAIEAWVLHMATLVNIYTLGRRIAGNRASGLLATFFAYFAVNAGFGGWVVRSGLAEVMGNNNPVLHAFFFAILLLAESVVRRPTVPRALLLGTLLGGFDHVYETHFHVVALGILILAGLCALRWWRPRDWRRVCALLLLSVGLGSVVMLVSGGLTARMVGSRLQSLAPGASRVAESAPPPGDAFAFALAGAQQKVEIGFPKRPFLSLTHASDGRPVALLGWEFLSAQGLGFWLLPLSTLVLAWRRRPLGTACALMAVASILVPACIDFGRFNGENFRYIFLSGLLAAICAGLMAGEAYTAITLPGRWVRLRRLAAFAVLGVLAYKSTGVYQQREEYARKSIPQPQLFHLIEEERLDQFCVDYTAADSEATEYLATHGALGHRLAANYAAPLQNGLDIPNNAMVIMSGAQMPMVGFNARIMRKGGGIQTSVSGWSGRATAFWATGDSEILRDLGADWLYVVPDWLPPGVSEMLSRSPGLREAFRSSSGGRRVVYRVDRAALGPRPAPNRGSLTGLKLVAVAGVDAGAPDAFSVLRATVQSTGSAPIAGLTYVSYKIRDLTASADYDPADSVGTVHALRIEPGGSQTIDLPFVFPYNPGEYRLTLHAHAVDGDLMLGDVDFTVASGRR